MCCINTLIIYILIVSVKYKIEMKIDNKYKIINNPNANKINSIN